MPRAKRSQPTASDAEAWATAISQRQILSDAARSAALGCMRAPNPAMSRTCETWDLRVSSIRTVDLAPLICYRRIHAKRINVLYLTVLGGAARAFAHSDEEGWGAVCYRGAPLYVNRFIDWSQRRVFSRLLAAAHFSKGDSALDIGCGTGRWTRALADASLQVMGSCRQAWSRGHAKFPLILHSMLRPLPRYLWMIPVCNWLPRSLSSITWNLTIRKRRSRNWRV